MSDFTYTVFLIWRVERFSGWVVYRWRVGVLVYDARPRNETSEPAELARAA